MTSCIHRSLIPHNPPVPSPPGSCCMRGNSHIWTNKAHCILLYKSVKCQKSHSSGQWPLKSSDGTISRHLAQPFRYSEHHEDFLSKEKTNITPVKRYLPSVNTKLSHLLNPPRRLTKKLPFQVKLQYRRPTVRVCTGLNQGCRCRLYGTYLFCSASFNIHKLQNYLEA